MNENVSFKVKGIQTDVDGNQNIEKEENQGRYYNKNGNHYIMADGARYRFNHRSLEVVKNGDLNAKLIFENGQCRVCDYATPYGNFPLEFRTKQISLSESEREIEISVEYEIFNQDEFVSKNHTIISVFSLTGLFS